jgi:hypothetical protein
VDTAKTAVDDVGMDQGAVPIPEGPESSDEVQRRQFLADVDRLGWPRASLKHGLKYAVVILAALVVDYLSKAGGNVRAEATKQPIKSTEELAREALADSPEVAAPRVREARAADEGVGPTVPEPAAANTRPQVGAADASAASDRFLLRLQELEKAQEQSIAQRLVVARGREGVLYGAQLFAALITIVLALVAVGLIFAGSVPVAVASGAIAILPGSGTVLLRGIWTQERGQRDKLEAARSEAAATIDSIEAARSVPDDEARARLMVQLAERVQQRLSPPPARRDA